MNKRRQNPDNPPTRPTTGAPRSPGESITPRGRGTPSKRRVVVREPRRMNPLLRVINGILSFAFFSSIAAAGVALYVRNAIDDPGPLRQAKTIAIPKGEGSHEIAARLERDGMISDRRLFIAGYWWQSLAARFGSAKPVALKAGEYEIKEGASVRSIVDIMNEGRTLLVRVTVPEGLTSHQIVERIKADPTLTGDIAALPAEGSLMPDTYAVPRGATRQFVIDQMAEAQTRVVEKLWAARQDGLPFATVADALTMASIIEKETGRNDERDRVAAVFVNRLRNKMRIESDPTILYGLFLGKVQWGKPILRSEIRSATEHNTYVIPGLPPTPICNPGRAALEATLNPAQTKELYFVADGKGGHVFAETLKDHNANVARWRQVEQARNAAAAAAAATAAAPPAAPAAPAATPRKAAPVQRPAQAAPVVQPATLAPVGKSTAKQ